jgi:hypothetical protein
MITNPTQRSENVGAPQRVPRFLSFLPPSTAESFCTTQELPSSSGIKCGNRRATSAAQTTKACGRTLPGCAQRNYQPMKR